MCLWRSRVVLPQHQRLDPGGGARPSGAERPRRRASAARAPEGARRGGVGRASPRHEPPSRGEAPRELGGVPRGGARERRANGRASTAATSWHFSPLTIGFRATVSEPESIAWTLRALSSACDSTTGSSSSSAAAAASKSPSEHASEPVSESDAAKSDSEASDMVRGRVSLDSGETPRRRAAGCPDSRGSKRARGGGERSRLQRKSTDDAASGFALRSRGGPRVRRSVARARPALLATM